MSGAGGGNFEDCTHVTPQCPIEATIYGYRPSLAGNIILLCIFSITALAQLALAIRYRLLSFGIVVTIGCFTEAAGYIGRILLYYNPWSDSAFDLQIVCLILAPSFLAAGIYLTMKHVILELGSDLSYLRPELYTWIFISADASSIVLQATGGGIASTSTGSLLQVGNDLIIAGIAVQVVTMGICLILAIDFGIAFLRRSGRQRHDRDKEADFEREKCSAYFITRGLSFYLGCISVAFAMIFIRCVYRLPEMAGGWGNSIMREQTLFMVLDGGLIAIATILMTIAYPGIFFPEIKKIRQTR